MIARRVVLGCLVLMISVCTWTIGRAAENDGEQVYRNNCQRCHGLEGRGAEAPILVPFRWSYQETLHLVREPECDMPAFSASDLSDEAVAEIVAYLKTVT